MKGFIIRNLRIYLRDRLSVFFSLLSVMITALLYVVFLSGFHADLIIGSYTHDLVPETMVYKFVNSWVLSGLLSIVCVTSTLGAFGTMTMDRERKIMRDFISSPNSRAAYPIAMMVCSCIIGIIMSLIVFFVYGLYLYFSLHMVFSIIQIIQTIGLIAVSTLTCAAVIGFFVSLLNTQSSFTSLSIVTGTLIGFLTGTFVPTGVLPYWVRDILYLMPFAHISALFRQVLMGESLGVMEQFLSSISSGSIRHVYGVDVYFYKYLVSPWVSMLFIVAVFLLGSILFFISATGKKKRI